MASFDFLSNGEHDTDRLGRALADALPSRAVVALVGTLGAGKTRLVQGIAKALGIDPATVVSPTFVLVHEYPGERPIYHFDAYRLKDDDEFWALGPEEYYDREGLTILEWADRIERCLPSDRIEITIAVVGQSQRRFTVRGTGGEHQQAVERLAMSLASAI